jgi:predicted Zn-dependent protease
LIRREFLKVASTAVGAVTLAPWMLEREAAEAAEVDAVKSALAEAALTRAKVLGASYADIRINRYRSESITTRERQVQNVARNQDFGFGVRVLVKGTWGFAASSIVTPEEIRRVTKTAVDIALANAAFQRKRVTLAPVDPVTANWRSAFEKDPFDVPLDDKIQFLLALNGIALQTNGVSFVNSSMSWVNEQRFLATMHLVRNGTVETLRYSRYWAQQKSRQPSGPLGFVLEPSTPGVGLDEMIKTTKRALLVSRFFYIRTVDPRSASVTGLTRDGVWYVEDGEIKYPVRNFRFNQSIVLMLGPGNVDLIGVPERVASSEGGTDPLLVPALRLNAFNFTSQSEAV